MKKTTILLLTLLLTGCMSTRYGRQAHDYPECPDSWDGSLASWYYFYDCVGGQPETASRYDCERCYFTAIQKYDKK